MDYLATIVIRCRSELAVSGCVGWIRPA